MKLVTFRAQDGAARVGAAVDGERIVPLPIAADMLDLIRRWSELGEEVRRLASGARGAMPLVRDNLLAPIPRPGKIMAIGLNYADHVAESGQQTPPHQIWFSKAATAAHAPFAPVEIPKASALVDYEAELVAVIGAGGRHVGRGDAHAAVFGFCAGNDVSVRDWQMRTSQWVLGKSFDTHAPFGPWIVTADEIADPHILGIRCFVNGEKRQDSNTRHLIFDVWAQIEHLSQVMTLEPGDLIFTGTPGGVGAAMNPRQFLESGDRARVEIDQVGAIENVFEPES
ncbi:MAG TPA: fumarylacetoacetate hydrolase family protein [Caulobacteraceae bacterium]|nr:fumarylacetoacetate hydrolase family protein [Caulobacteraceae bacterium]